MKTSVLNTLACSLIVGLAGLAAPASGWAGVDADGAMALAKKSGCLKCHAVDKDKNGPSFKKTAAKWKGKADAEAKLTEAITKSPKVKLKDGTEEDHKVVDTKDAAEIKNLVDWVLAQ